jgi:hypothetical protein
MWGGEACLVCMYAENRGSRGAWIIGIALVLDAVICAAFALQVRVGTPPPDPMLVSPPDDDMPCERNRLISDEDCPQREYSLQD